MEKLITVVLLATAISCQKPPKIKQNELLFTPDILDPYSLTTQIFQTIKQQQMAKNRPVSILQPMSFPQVQKKQPNAHIIGFTKEATVMRPPVTIQNQISSIIATPNVPVSVGTRGVLKLDHQVSFQVEVVKFGEGRNYQIYDINQGSVLDQTGNIRKIDQTKTGEKAKQQVKTQQRIEPTTKTEDFQAKLDQFSNFIKNKIDLAGAKDNPEPKNIQAEPLPKPDQNQIKNTNEIPGSTAANKRIRTNDKNPYPFQTEAQQIRRQQQQQIIKLFFSALLLISILLVVFGYRPHKKQGGIESKDEEENALK